jgi:hypothetical protein
MYRNGSLEELQALARQRGGVCLSTVYINSTQKLDWRCAAGHTWSALPGNIKNKGSWCPRCGDKRAGMARRLGIVAMQALAAKHGGTCLSTTYANIYTPLRWRCGAGHSFKATAVQLKRRLSFCPRC